VIYSQVASQGTGAVNVLSADMTKCSLSNSTYDAEGSVPMKPCMCRKLNLSEVKYFVLDEADEMLNMGFQDDVECILETVPAERQTMFFSATVPQWVRKLAGKYCKKHIMVDLVGESSTGAVSCNLH
jgi:hypothetical protein